MIRKCHLVLLLLFAVARAETEARAEARAEAVAGAGARAEAVAGAGAEAVALFEEIKTEHAQARPQ